MTTISIRMNSKLQSVKVNSKRKIVTKNSTGSKMMIILMMILISLKNLDLMSLKREVKMR
jgi:hypothetical protein